MVFSRTHEKIRLSVQQMVDGFDMKDRRGVRIQDVLAYFRRYPWITTKNNYPPNKDEEAGKEFVKRKFDRSKVKDPKVRVGASKKIVARNGDYETPLKEAVDKQPVLALIAAPVEALERCKGERFMWDRDLLLHPDPV